MKLQSSLLTALASIITVNIVVLSDSAFHKTFAETVSLPAT
jgi:hypothetical protein